MRQYVCLDFNPVMVDSYAAFVNCTPVGRASDSVMAPELQLNKVNISDPKVPFLDLHLSVANGFVSSKINDKR